MKKTMFLLAMSMTVMGLSAQSISQTGIRLGSQPGGYIPAGYSADGKTCLTFESVNKDGSGEIAVYDDNISLTKTISVPKAENSQGYTEIWEREGIFVVAYEGRENMGGPYTLDEVKDGWNCDSTYSVNDTTYLYGKSGEFYYYYYEQRYGRKYPMRFLAYAPDGYLYLIVREAYIKYTDNIVSKRRDESFYHEPKAPFATIEVCDYDDEKWPLGWINASQRLFNNDDAYEFIMPTFEYYPAEKIDRDYYFEVFYEPRATGFSVVSGNGGTVQTIAFGSGLYSDKEDYKLIKINGKHYLLCNVYEEKENESRQYYSILYSVTPGATGIRQVDAPIKTRVYPTVTDRNGTVTVETGGDGSAAHEVIVANAAGQTLLRTTVPAGRRSVSINADRMSRGMNIVSIKGGKESAGSHKVIVR